MTKLTPLLLLTPLFLSACASLLTVEKKLEDKLNTYKQDMHQGSILKNLDINQLKLGMTKAEISNLIGSPSIIDPFHNNQWDYINYSTLHRANDIHYHLTLNFTGEILSHINTYGLKSLVRVSAKERALASDRRAEQKILAEEKIARQSRIEIERVAKDAIELYRTLDEKAKAEREVKAELEAESIKIAEEKALIAARLRIKDELRAKAKIKAMKKEKKARALASAKAKAITQARIEERKKQLIKEEIRNEARKQAQELKKIRLEAQLRRQIEIEMTKKIKDAVRAQTSAQNELQQIRDEQDLKAALKIEATKKRILSEAAGADHQKAVEQTTGGAKEEEDRAWYKLP